MYEDKKINVKADCPACGKFSSLTSDVAEDPLGAKLVAICSSCGWTRAWRVSKLIWMEEEE